MIAVIPMHVEYHGHIIVPVALDSHEIDALLDTGATTTHLSLEAAEGVFNLAPGSPALTRTGDFRGAARTPVFVHSFGSLALQGITIRNPSVGIWDDLGKAAFQQNPHLGSRLNQSDERNGVASLVVGTRELRHLHIYIAYKEQKLYVSPASDAAAPTAGETGVPTTSTSTARHAPTPLPP